MGSKGSLLISSDCVTKIPCVPNIDVYDPTGAGDSFAGGLIGYISKYGDENMMEALLYASSIASFTVSDFGINKILNLNPYSLDKEKNLYLRKLFAKITACPPEI